MQMITLGLLFNWAYSDDFGFEAASSPAVRILFGVDAGFLHLLEVVTFV